jgi:hypothetical protein
MNAGKRKWTAKWITKGIACASFAFAAALSSKALAQAAPTVVNVPANSGPVPQSGLKVTCLEGPNVLVSSQTCPVIKYKGYTFWAYSFVDNRVAMALVRYGRDGKMQALRDLPGTRYVWKITIDPKTKTATLWGQANATASVPFKFPATVGY